MVRITLLILGIWIISSTGLLSQTKEFPKDPEKFPDAIMEYLKASITDKTKEMLDEYWKIWDADSLISLDEKNGIVLLCNRFIKVNARPSPHFINLFPVLFLMKTDPKVANFYNAWLGGLDVILGAKKVSLTSLNNYLENTYSLFSKNSIYESTSLKWRASSPEYTFELNGEIKIRFKNTDLICEALRDSIVIKKTSGWYNPIENVWYGNQGVVTWERAGYSSDELYANLRSYKINLTRISYEADSVEFVNKQFFEKPLNGVLKDQVKFNAQPDAAIYPEFQSYTKEFNIKDIYENLDYEGGLTMKGARLIGSGNKQQLAHLYLYRNDTLFVKVFSMYFSFRKEKVVASDAGVVVSFHQDSIYHSDMTFTYLVNTKEMSITHSEAYATKSPWFNSYHKLDMDFDQLAWKVGEPYLQFTMNRGASIGNAKFQSVSFFSYPEYESLQGIDPVNPLIILRNFVRDYFYGEEFMAGDLANYMRLPVEQVRIMLLQMSVKGFVYYNVETDQARIKPKLYDNIKASIGKIDYDVITLNSRTSAPTPNATIDLRNFNMKINGLQAISVSDSQNVAIFPIGGTITMKGNRSFQFDGIVDAGLFTFFGSNFFFDYDAFKINLQQVDSLSIRVITGEKDNYGMDIQRDVSNMVQKVTGELLIDDPGNKSGVEKYPQYPIFRSKENSHVFYDSPSIQKGVYQRDEFYFQIYPFEIDSLDNFTKEDMKFRGKFVSAGIFPEMEQTLVLQPDYSLGFDINAPNGIPVYGGKGTFFSKANLSNNGLKGNGSILYLTSETWSKDFNFYPDSVNALAGQFALKPQVSDPATPKGSANEIFVHWLPKQDDFNAKSIKTRFSLYNPETFLSGSLRLRPSGLTGSGLVDLTTAETNSKLFTFRMNDYSADTASFNLKSLKKEGFTLLTNNVKAKVDFRERTGNFESNSDVTFAEFPENRYISFIDNMTWKMDRKEVDLNSNKKFNPAIVPTTYKKDYIPEDETLVGARYISVQKDQDSLSFISPSTTYNYQENLMYAKKVKYIKVADALIFPNTGTLVIGERADMQWIDTAVVVANLNNRYHKIHTARIKIFNRYLFKGEGWYDYVDETDQIQRIHFVEVDVDSTKQTIANGAIAEPDDFTLSPDYAYQGKVFLSAREPFLNFKGATRLNWECEKMERSWIYFNTSINPDSIYIPISSQPIDINRINIYDGMFLTTDSIHVYSTFFGTRKNYNDKFISSGEGFLHFIKDSATYVVGSYEKIKNLDFPGNLVAFNRNNCHFYGQGKVDLNINLGRMTLQSAGSVMHDLETNQPYLDIMLTANFSLYDKSLALMASDFDSLPGLSPTDLSAKKYTRALDELLGPVRAKQIKEEIGLYGKYKEVPPELMVPIVLTDVKLKWNDVTNSYQSYGTIGVGNIMGTQVNKNMEGYVEIYRKRSGDNCDIYLKLNDKTWYYFGYTREVMQAYSSNVDFNRSLLELKPEQRTIKAERGIPSYIYMVASDTKIGQFMRKYRQILEGQSSGTENEDEP